ncbi:unnamed protein product [Phaedon cochleariae]|uniref:Bifunctional lysine-specific demethylase and histidyl-hydroxylase n=1 Tax=Phaedon cochleariae TaxID=80249 RepID=A0A9P0GUE7_PHACE|nr:unnamed protein product [Phaedon cochleariae]
MSLPESSPVSAFLMYKKKSKNNKPKLKSTGHEESNLSGSPPSKKNKKLLKSDQHNKKHLKVKNKELRISVENPKKHKGITPSTQLFDDRRMIKRKQNGVATTKKLKKPLQKHLIESSDENPPILVPIQTPSTGSSLRSEAIMDASISEFMSKLNKTDPSPEGLKLFKWLIAPINPSVFFDEYWENEVMHIKRDKPSYYTCILTTQRLDDIFREFPLYYTTNVDVVSYENGVKEVHNEQGRVVASGLYDYYSNGCSIRVLNPHTYDQKVHLLISTLQEYFGAMVGANVYLTPPNSQGFAPHYDDIEAFVVQLEGRKYWKLYKPKGSDILARTSSGNFKHEDIGEPFMEVTLNAGDLLYFPRGTIHEGRTDPDQHSLHITVSVYQQNSYADLLEQLLPQALKTAATNNIDFRKGLPLNYLKHLGCVNKNKKTKERKAMEKNMEKLVKDLVNYMDIDLAADKLGRKFMYDSMPPVLSKQEVYYTSKYDGDFMRDGKIYNRIEIGMDTEVRLVRYHCLRLVVEDVPKIYYNTENAKYYHGEEEQFLVIDHDLTSCVAKLQNDYPEFTRVEDLPTEDGIAKAQLVSDLWERGLLVTNGPLTALSDGEDEDIESELSE